MLDACRDQPHGGEWGRNWPLVLGGMLGYSCLALQAFLIGPFILPIEREFGWSRAQIMAGLSIMHVAGIAFNAAAGILIDRIGARPVALFGQVLACSGFALLGLATASLTGWALHWLLISAGCALMHSTGWTRVVAAHFDRSRGLAIATVLTGSSLTAALAPVIAGAMIASFDWRTAITAVPLIWLALTFPFSFFLFRSPHAHRQGPGRAAAQASAAPRGAADDATLAEALRTPVFWCVAFALLSFAAYSLAIAPSLVPMLVEKGIAATEAAKLASILGIAGFVARLSMGHLLDRFATNIVAGASFCMPVAGLVLLFYAGHSLPLLILSIVFVGATLGAEYDVIIYLLTRHFGLRHFGTIFGVILSLGAVGSTIAPVATGWSHDATGGYDQVMMTLAVMMSGCAIGMFAFGGRGRVLEDDRGSHA